MGYFPYISPLNHIFHSPGCEQPQDLRSSPAIRGWWVPAPILLGGFFIFYLFLPDLGRKKAFYWVKDEEKKKKSKNQHPNQNTSQEASPAPPNTPGSFTCFLGVSLWDPPHRDAARMGGSHAPQIYPGIGMRCTRDPFLPSNPIRAVPPPGGGGVIWGGGIPAPLW